MMQKIVGHFGHIEQMKRFVSEAEAMIEKYKWHDRTVMPYGFAMPVTKIIADCKDYSKCTIGSQSYLIALANGLVDILNAWEAYHNAPKVTIRHKATNKTYVINADMAVMFTDDGFEIIA